MTLESELLAEKVSLINTHYRRLDILSQMLEGVDQAASLCFDGENLLFACNSPRRAPIQTEIFSHLTRIANIDYSQKNYREQF